MNENILEILTDNALNERLNGVLLQDEEYQGIQVEIEGLEEKFYELKLPKEQRLIIDNLVSANTDSGCCYGWIAYQQGFRDCASLLVEIGLIKDGKEFKEDGKISNGHRISE